MYLRVPGQEREHHMAQAARACPLSVWDRTSVWWDTWARVTSLLSFRRHCPPSPPQLCEMRKPVAWSAEVTQVAAMDPAQCPSEDATRPSETSLDGGDIW